MPLKTQKNRNGGNYENQESEYILRKGCTGRTAQVEKKPGMAGVYRAAYDIRLLWHL